MKSKQQIGIVGRDDNFSVCATTIDGESYEMPDTETHYLECNAGCLVKFRTRKNRVLPTTSVVVLCGDIIEQDWINAIESLDK